MERVKYISLKLYSHSFVRYVFIGGTTFAIDFFLLVLLHGVLGIKVLVAATISYWTSIIFNFLANRFWAFNSTGTSIARHVVPYGILLGLNYLFTIAFIGTATHLGMYYTHAKILAVIIQISWTYFIYKKVIFR